MRRTLIKAAIAAFVMILTATAVAPAAERTYREWSAAGKQMYIAFECAALASAAKMPDATTKHYRRGLDLGRPLLHAIFEGRVKPQKDLWIMPIGALVCANGPTADFALGRIFQCARDNALQFVITVPGAAKRAAEAARTYARRCEESAR